MAESLVAASADERRSAGDELLQLQFLFHDLVQFSGAALSIVRVRVGDLHLMQLLAAARNGRAHGSFGIGRLLRLRDKCTHQFPFCADYVKFHSYNQFCKFRLWATGCVPGLWISTV